MIDTVHTVETPEGVRLELRTAGPVPRALAFMVDSLVRSVFYITAVIALAVTIPQLAGAIMIVLFFLGEWFYPVFCEVWNQGQTLGKKTLGLRVVREDGTRVGWSASLLRNLLLAADWIPGTYAAGLVSMSTSPGFQRLGDLAAGTLVIHVERPPAPLPEVEATPVAPPIPLTVEEQRAVGAFAERAPLLSEARAKELAALAIPLQAPPAPARERLLGIGAWLLGRGGGSGP